MATTNNDNEKLKKAFSGDLIDRLTYRLPGTGPRISPSGYTSEQDIREQVTSILNMPQRTMTAEQLAAVGLDHDPLLKQTLTTKNRLSVEEKRKVADKWIAQLTANAKKKGRLMTEQQLADWRLGRKLGTGDKARYIGPDREEITQAQLIVPRPTGQTGIISGVTEAKTGRTIVFYPDEPQEPVEAPGAERQYVALEVREHTPGWLNLERIPPT